MYYRNRYSSRNQLLSPVFFSAVDCTWGDWGEWSACPNKCGISKKMRSREKNEHECGGIPCQGNSVAYKNCDRFAELMIENDKVQENLSKCSSDYERLDKKLCKNVRCQNGSNCIEGECKYDTYKLVK